MCSTASVLQLMRVCWPLTGLAEFSTAFFMYLEKGPGLKQIFFTLGRKRHQIPYPSRKNYITHFWFIPCLVLNSVKTNILCLHLYFNPHTSFLHINDISNRSILVRGKYTDQGETHCLSSEAILWLWGSSDRLWMWFARRHKHQVHLVLTGGDILYS